MLLQLMKQTIGFVLTIKDGLFSKKRHIFALETEAERDKMVAEINSYSDVSVLSFHPPLRVPLTHLPPFISGPPKRSKRAAPNSGCGADLQWLLGGLGGLVQGALCRGGGQVS